MKLVRTSMAAVTAFLAVFAIAWWVQSDGRVPFAAPQATRVAEKAARDYLLRIAAMYDEAQSRIDKGSQTEDQAVDWISAESAAIRRSAYQPIFDYAEANESTRWYAETGEGFRRAAR